MTEQSPEQIPETGQRRFYVLGGNLALDFHNTILWSREETAAAEAPLVRTEFLADYGGLLDWAQEVKCVEGRERDLLRREAAAYPEEAASALSSALDLREILHGIFSAIARGDKPEPAALARLNAALADVMSRLRVSPAGHDYRWEWSSSGTLTRPLWPVVRAAADLLTSGDVHRVRRCGGDPCGFLFVDHSRRGRRWCDMSLCGSRAKSRSYYRRTRALRTPAE